ncbi:triacylglycerol lipase, putative [Ricinus communis]|uniref:Triacylglycerol lipase, putative n=2 Tax=Ricinus communis TaxID=3988 RepID=B9T2A9_RICCO|nr:triacylglycerol lipase, putative [Ricinus communis]
MSKPDNEQVEALKEEKNAPQVSSRPKLGKYSSDDDVKDSKWRLELAWLTKALEPALQLWNGLGNRTPPTGRSLMEIVASIQRSKIAIEGWSLSDLTIGLYLIYLRQSSLNPFEDFKGVQIASELVVRDLIYHIELAKGSYKDNAFWLARNSMLRESNILKFVKDSSVMRPGYYIGVDPRKKLLIVGIRGTHTVYDLITDIVTSSDREVTFEGFSTHFGTAEAARWFLNHEMGTIRKYLEKYEGFRLRLVGHSLGAATASLLAIMLRKKSPEELGFSPDIVSAVGYATPPCVSRELAETCADFVKTVVMQEDIVPRLSVAALGRLKNEILQTDWMSVIEKEDWRSVIGLVTNAKQVVSSVQDVARKLADYAKFRSNKIFPDHPISKASTTSPGIITSTSGATTEKDMVLEKEGAASTVPEELFVPGTVYYLKKDIDVQTCSRDGRGVEFFTLWKRHPGEHFQRIVLSSNIISDHKCDSHYYALRDVLKALPGTGEEGIFR